ncbi:hypothetical protein [Catenulispora subtropica]|uniref:Uncharacterized protein n=1 Tax=Catenulispora subtropica TaxID=450798 RepID=A0ABN2T1Z9_9ACTN
MEHGPGDLTKAQQRQVLDLLGSELRAAWRAAVTPEADDDGPPEEAAERAAARRAALAAHLEDRRAALEHHSEEAPAEAVGSEESQNLDETVTS